MRSSWTAFEKKSDCTKIDNNIDRGIRRKKITCHILERSMMFTSSLNCATFDGLGRSRQASIGSHLARFELSDSIVLIKSSPYTSLTCSTDESSKNFKRKYSTAPNRYLWTIRCDEYWFFFLYFFTIAMSWQLKTIDWEFFFCL